MRRALLLTALALPLCVVTAEAQVGSGGRAGGIPGAMQPRRLQLELQLRRGLWRVAKQRLALTDQQMVRLEQIGQRFDERRRALAGDEREQRTALRTEILADSEANQTRVAAALDRLLQLQRQRVELQADEQKEFATFMTPIQRAKFLVLQEQVRRRMEVLRSARPDSGAAPGR